MINKIVPTLGYELGIELLKEINKDVNTEKCVFHLDPIQMAYNLGRQSVGMELTEKFNKTRKENLR